MIPPAAISREPKGDEYRRTKKGRVWITKSKYAPFLFAWASDEGLSSTLEMVRAGGSKRYQDLTLRSTSFVVPSYINCVLT